MKAQQVSGLFFHQFQKPFVFILKDYIYRKNKKMGSKDSIQGKQYDCKHMLQSVQRLQ